jgi:hypothetical protein
MFFRLSHLPPWRSHRSSERISPQLWTPIISYIAVDARYFLESQEHSTSILDSNTIPQPANTQTVGVHNL